MKSRCRMNSCTTVEAFSTKILLNVALPCVTGVEFEAFLRQAAEGILDRVVRELVSEADRIVFEEESSDVTA